MQSPIAWHVTHWRTDPFSLGAYSTLLPGGTAQHRHVLGQCLDGRLVLAGEACNPDAPAMTHGAWNDGLRAAELAISQGASRVIIVGAGCAGLAAANRLREAGVECVVLEARERIGGRTHSLRLGDATVDLGAAWLQQFADNALARVAEQQGLALIPTDFVHSLSAASDGPVPDVEAAWSALRMNLDRSLPLAEAVESYLAGLQTEQARAARLAIEANLIQEACLPLAQLSVDVLEEEGMGNDDRFLPGGYGQLIERLAAGLDIRLGQPVARIDWSGQVQVNDERADFCICTVPLGVLKTLAFNPALPEAQQDALAHLAMGRLEKVVLQFKERWWPRSDSGFLRWYDTPASWCEWLDLTEVAGTPTVVGLIAADAIERHFDGRSDEQIALAACAALQSWAAAVERHSGAPTER